MSFDNTYNGTDDYGDLTLVELKFQEMRREVGRIGEIATDVKNSLSSLIGAINTLAGLVRASPVSSSASIGKIEAIENEISSFALTQIERYAALNEMTFEQVQKLDYLLMQLFDKDGQIVTYNIDGEEVTETFTKLLKRKQKEDTSIFDSTKEGYRVLENNEWLNSALNVSDDRWDNFESMYTYFSENGLTDEQISGIMANAAGESGFYSEAKNTTSTAKGFFQWLDSRYPENWEVNTQLDHAWDEMENVLNYGGISTLDRIKNCTTPEESSNVFLQYFEGAGSPVNGPFKNLYPTREKFARDIYNYIQKMKNTDINTSIAV